MGASLSLTLSESSVNVAANTSVVKAVLKVKSTSGTYNQVDSCTGTIKIDGTSYSFKHYFSANTTTTLATKSKTVTHNADGSKTVSVSATYKTGTSAGTISTSKSITLTKINRNFTVSLNYQGGEGTVSSLTKTYGSALTLPSPTREGYTFGGWCTGANGTGTNYNTTYTTEAATTLYAYWIERTALLTYSNNGHGTAPDSVTMKYTVETVASSISATGYTFQGWKRSDDGTIISVGDVVKAADVIPTALTLTAQWEANQYTITYNANGATGTVPNPNTVDYGSSITLPIIGEELSKRGYTFKGWSTISNTEAAQYLGGTTVVWNTANDVTLYAVWAPTLVYIRYYRNALERDFSNPSSYVELYVGDTVQYDSYTIENIIAPNITNYTFTGYWTTTRPNSKVYTEYGVSFPAGIVPYDYTSTELIAEGFLTTGSVLSQVIDTVYLYPIYKDNTATLISPYTTLYNYIPDSITELMYFQYASGQLSNLSFSVVDDDLIACAIFRTAAGAQEVSLDLTNIEASLVESEDSSISIELNPVYFNRVVNSNSNFSDLYVIYRTTGQSGGKLINPVSTDYTLSISGIKDSFGKNVSSAVINIYPPRIVRDVNVDADVIAFFQEAPDYTPTQKEDHPNNEVIINGDLIVKDNAYYKGLELIDLFYPIGSYYETSDILFDPNTAWGGTWVLEAEGQVHISAGTNYTIAGALTNTTDGGSADAIVPYHNHSVEAFNTPSGGTHTHAVKYRNDNTATGGKDRLGESGSYTGERDAAATTTGSSHSHQIPAHDTLYVGTEGNEVGANLPPYIIVNRWHRIA